MDTNDTLVPQEGQLISTEDLWNPYPGVISYDDGNPSLGSPNAEYDILFYQTPESMQDVDTYRNFIQSAVRQFRQSRYYKDYKSYLESLGLNKSQVLGNIDSEMATIELHHHILTIFDDALMITEHLLKTIGKVTTFDITEILIQEHQNNNIPLVMLDKTTHELYHASNGNLYIPLSRVYGRWWILIYKYRYGITMEIAKKLITYIKKYYDNAAPLTIQLNNDIMSFAQYNEYNYNTNSTMLYMKNDENRKIKYIE